MEIQTLPLAEILAEEYNVAELLDNDTLEKIGQRVLADYTIDEDSREQWKERNKIAFDLALQVMEEKNYPWPKASNVKFPLLTTACLQFQSRIYPQLIPGNDVVKHRVIGEDPDGAKQKRADRVSKHMSFQVLEEDESWEEETDKLLITMPIVGAGFKKTYFDPAKGHNVSEHVMATDLCIPYYAKSLETATRLTHIIPRYPNEMHEYQVAGLYRNIDLGAPRHQEDPRDEARGMTPPTQDDDRPYTTLEQHRYFDLDGDGYAEPYIVTIDKGTAEVLRIMPRFTEDDIILVEDEIAKIIPNHFFTKFPFIPSLDGGIYDLGFGVLLAPLNESVNSIINQLIDSGTLNNMQSGFLGRGIRLKSGETRITPGEWKRADSTGDDLRKQIVPLPTKEPSNVLFQLLGLLIEYGERLSSTTDIMVGESPGQNQPATTSLAVMEQGMKVYTGIFKRIYRSMKEEFRKLYRLNQTYLDPQVYFTTLDSGEAMAVLQEDYAGDPKDIRPAADPSMISDAQKILKAEALRQAAVSVPGYNTYEVEKSYLLAMGISDIEKIFPDPKGPNAIPPPADPKKEIEELKADVKRMEIKVKAATEKDKIDLEGDRLELDAAKIIAEIESMAAKEENESEKNDIERAKMIVQAVLSKKENNDSKKTV